MTFVLKRFFYSLAATSFFLSACGISGPPEGQAVITVGERNITTVALKRDIKRITLEMGITDQGVEHLMEPLINKIIDHYLILEYAREKRIVVSKNELESAVNDIRKDYPEKDFQKILLHGYIDFEEWKERLRQQLLTKKINTKVSEGITPISFEEIKGYFDSHRDEFRNPPMVRFRQIVARTKEDAEKILKRLAEGEDMAELAKKYSITPEADNGGEVGWIGKDDLEETMGKVIFSLPVGKTSPAVKTVYGFHIFKVLSLRPEGVKSLPEAMREIESKLFYQKEASFYGKWLKSLRGLFPVKVNRELLKTMELG